MTILISGQSEIDLLLLKIVVIVAKQTYKININKISFIQLSLGYKRTGY